MMGVAPVLIICGKVNSMLLTVVNCTVRFFLPYTLVNLIFLFIFASVITILSL